MSLLLWLSLRDAFTIPRAWSVFILPAIILIAGVAQYVVGYLIWKWNLIKEYSRWDSEQNPMMTEILENTSGENHLSRKHE